MDVEAITQQMRDVGWVLGDQLGEGGGGAVHLCFSADLADEVSHGVQKIAKTVALIGQPQIDLRVQAANSIIAPMLRALVTSPDLVGVAKLLKEPGARSTREIWAMEKCSHPNLTRLFAADTQDPAGWFVMQFHPHGDLESRQPDYRGKPLTVLKKIRPVVDALTVMHDRGVIHRDIKPSNILVGRNGDWILSDLGVVFDSEADRITVEQQTLVSKDWRPDWIAAQRLDDYGPDVDIFGVAKVVYFMISGSKVPASQIDAEGCDIRGLFPSVNGINRVHEFLAGHVVTKARDLKSKTAADFAAAIDGIISDLEQPRHRRRVISFMSTHSTTHVPPHAMARQSSAPFLIEPTDKRLLIRLRVLKGMSGPAEPLTFSVTLSRGDHRRSWKELDLKLPASANDEAIGSEPGVWSEECELAIESTLRPGEYDLALSAVNLPRFSVTGLLVDVD